jgi:hypothetical protein
MALDRTTMRTWMDAHRFTSPRLRWFVEYACRDDYGTLLDDTSAWAGIFYFASRVLKPGAEEASLITWPEGNGRFVDHFRAAIGPRILTGRAAVRVEGGPIARPNALAGTSSVRSELRGRAISPPSIVRTISRSGEWLNIEAERVIFAAPQFVAPYVIADFPAERVAAARTFSYGSWMVANLTLRDRPKQNGFPLAWDNILYESPSLGYVAATHQRGIEYGPTVLTYYYPLTGHDAKRERNILLAAGRNEWADVALADLSRAHREIRDITERVDVMRWGHAMIQPRAGFVSGDAIRRSREALGAVHFAHSDLSGVALFEEAFYQGVRAADEVRGHLGVRPR